jgi:hypothetical protein
VHSRPPNKESPAVEGPQHTGLKLDGISGGWVLLRRPALKFLWRRVVPAIEWRSGFFRPQ